MSRAGCGPPEKIGVEQLVQESRGCAILVVAAGFEDRAQRVLNVLSDCPIPRLIILRYPEGTRENDATYAAMRARLLESRVDKTVDSVTLDLRRTDEYVANLSASLRHWQPDVNGEVWIDVSAMAMQVICATLASVRATLPGIVVQVLYTEAAEYHPTKAEAAEAAKTGRDVPALSKEMAGNSIPKQFAGTASAALTCLIVFAGFEKHRSFGAVDELNPSRLVLVYGDPPRTELKWRLNWSKKLHLPLHRGRQSASEVVSTLDPLSSLALLNTYYGYLFSDHNIAVAPICSKMQCVGCYLFWERYRDVQIVFPLPVTYLPDHFSEKIRSTFRFSLPNATELANLTPSPL